MLGALFILSVTAGTILSGWSYPFWYDIVYCHNRVLASLFESRVPSEAFPMIGVFSSFFQKKRRKEVSPNL